jgi:acetylornithine deacetylase
MSALSKDPTAILSNLVSYRTDVVGGDERALAEHLGELLRAGGADEVTIADVPRERGKPASYVYGRFGNPRLLLNAHLDTVPPNADWSSDPFVPRFDDGRLYALGAADTKGAAAAILAALAEGPPKDTGILFSGDEEFSSVAMRAFIASHHKNGLERAIVCEPTNLAVGARHRGFVVLEVSASSPGGHSSLADTLPAPIAILARVAVALDDWGKAKRTVGPPEFRGMCLNVAKLDGGIAFNVIPAQARLLVSLRPPPGADTTAITNELEEIVRKAAPEASFGFPRKNVPFYTRSVDSFVPLLGDTARAPIDLGFWTEAALLAASGVDAVVFGPGSITHAHAPNEWVSLDELVRARDLFLGVMKATRV